MKKRTNVAILALGCTALVATAFARTPVIQQAALSAQSRLIKPIAEVTYFNGIVGVEFRIRKNGSSTIGNRDVIVVDLDPSLPKLVGGVTDNRTPRSGYLDVNGTIINLTPQADATLKATIPQSAINWFGGNSLSVEVYDGPPTASGAPIGKRFVGWSTDAYLQ
jgi:hypothetical protein